MEFHEKLQELRKKRGLTQEELAESLYVSRTAISKWESGRGYPSIDSLKEISRFFSVSIDELLSSEKILSLAENENKRNVHRICDYIIGVMDIMACLLIFLPLYPNRIDGYIYSVNLLAYKEITDLNLVVYWILFASLILTGMVKVLFTYCKTYKPQRTITVISITLSILTVLFLAMAREPYAITLSFLLLVVKGMMCINIQH